MLSSVRPGNVVVVDANWESGGHDPALETEQPEQRPSIHFQRRGPFMVGRLRGGAALVGQGCAPATNPHHPPTRWHFLGAAQQRLVVPDSAPPGRQPAAARAAIPKQSHGEKATMAWPPVRPRLNMGGPPMQGHGGW